MTYIELAQEEALKLGIVLSAEAADYILWEKTAFPLLTEDELRREVHAELTSEGWRSHQVKKSGPTAWDKLKSEDSED